MVDAAIWIHQGKDQKPLTTPTNRAELFPFVEMLVLIEPGAALTALPRDVLYQPVTGLVATTLVIFAVSGISRDNPPRGYLNRELCAPVVQPDRATDF